MISIERLKEVPEKYRLAVISVLLGERPKWQACRIFSITESYMDSLLLKIDPKITYDKVFHKEVHQILDYCNEVWGTQFSDYTDLNQIESVWKLRVYTLEDICAVIKNKANDWKNTDYQKYLRPQTIFTPEKFKKYHEEQIKKEQNNGFSKIIAVTQSVIQDWQMD
jgi:hypothetical protein